jgi:hypothetical protein
MTYGSLIEAVLSKAGPYLVDDEFLTRNAGSYVNRAVYIAQQVYNFPCMEASIQLTTAVNTTALGNKPTRFKSVRGNPYLVRFTGNEHQELFDAWWTEQDVLRRYKEDTRVVGPPKVILELPKSFKVYPMPDGASDWTGGEYRVKILYWEYLRDLAVDADTNWFTENAAQYIIWAAAGLLLEDVPGQETNAMRWTVTEEPLINPTTRADKELFRLVRRAKTDALPKRIFVMPQRDAQAPRDRLNLR